MTIRSTNDSALEVETDAFLEKCDYYRDGDFHATVAAGGTLFIRDAASDFLTSYAPGTWSSVRPLDNGDRATLTPAT